MLFVLPSLFGQVAATITGRITGEGGEPLSGAVTAVTNMGSVQIRSSATGERGVFAVTVPAGIVQLVASADGYVSGRRQVLAVSGRANPPLHFVLSPAGSVSGRVVDAQGTPVPRARVWLSYRGEAGGWRRAEEAGGDEADAFGQFSIPVVAQGKPFVLHAESDEWLVSSSGTMLLRADQMQGILLLLSRRGTTISGRIVDDGGRPVSGAVVRLRAIPADGEFTDEQRALPAFARNAHKTGITGPDGTYTFTAVPLGRVVVTAESAGRRGSSEVAASIRQTVRLDVTMR
jgi:protocatechuate 3,4-dioxygenase beta subunit